jgi:hypothetical protein
MPFSCRSSSVQVRPSPPHQRLPDGRKRRGDGAAADLTRRLHRQNVFFGVAPALLTGRLGGRLCSSRVPPPWVVDGRKLRIEPAYPETQRPSHYVAFWGCRSGIGTGRGAAEFRRTSQKIPGFRGSIP